MLDITNPSASTILSLILLATATAAVFLAARWRRLARTVRRDSESVRRARTLASQYGPKVAARAACNVQASTTTKSKKALEKFDIKAFLIETVQKRQAAITAEFSKHDRALHAYAEYVDELRSAGSALGQVSGRSAKQQQAINKLERKYFDRTILQPPPRELSGEIVVTATYTSPAGRNHYTRNASLPIEGARQILGLQPAPRSVTKPTTPTRGPVNSSESAGSRGIGGRKRLGSTAGSPGMPAPTKGVVCSWGFFNPMGPTVGKIVMNTVNNRVQLSFLQHHELSPETRELLSVNGKIESPSVMDAAKRAIDAAIRDDESIIGSGPSYLVVHEAAFTDCIREAYIARMVTIESAQEMREEAEDLLARPDQPWERATEAIDFTRAFQPDWQDRPRPDPDSPESRAAAEQLWAAITDPRVVEGIVPEMGSAAAMAQASLDAIRSGSAPSNPTARPTRSGGGSKSTGGSALGRSTLDYLQSTLYMDAEWTERSEGRIVWTAGSAPMVLTVSEPFIKYGDQAIKFTAECTFIENVTAHEDIVLRAVDRLNLDGSVGTFVWNADRRTISVFTSDYPHAGSESLARFRSAFILLAYSEAMSDRARSVADEVGGTFVSVRSDQDELLDFTELKVIPAGSGPLQWDQSELKGIQSFVAQRGLDGYSDRNRMSVEFPYTGTTSQLSVMNRTGKRPSGPPQTSLYEQYVAAFPHDTYGVGLRGRLRLPGLIGEAASRRVANALNLAERDEVTGFPSWGAWVEFDEGVAHMAFFPNLYGTTGLLTTIVGYAVMRGEWIAEKSDLVEAIAMQPGPEPEPASSVTSPAPDSNDRDGEAHWLSRDKTSQRIGGDSNSSSPTPEPEPASSVTSPAPDSDDRDGEAHWLSRDKTSQRIGGASNSSSPTPEPDRQSHDSHHEPPAPQPSAAADSLDQVDPDLVGDRQPEPTGDLDQDGLIEPPEDWSSFEPFEVTVVGDGEVLTSATVDAHSRAQVRTVIDAIIHHEAPVELNRFCRLVASSFGLSRLHEKRKDEIIALLEPGSLHRDHFSTFVMPSGSDLNDVRGARVVDPEIGQARAIKEVPIIEYTNVLDFGLTFEPVVERDDIIWMFALVLGIKRITAKTREDLAEVLDVVVSTGRFVFDEEGRIRREV